MFYKPREKRSLKRCVFRFSLKEERDGELRTFVGRELQILAAWKWKNLFPADLRLVLGTFNSFSLLDRHFLVCPTPSLTVRDEGIPTMSPFHSIVSTSDDLPHDSLIPSPSPTHTPSPICLCLSVSVYLSLSFCLCLSVCLSLMSLLSSGSK